MILTNRCALPRLFAVVDGNFILRSGESATVRGPVYVWDIYTWDCWRSVAPEWGWMTWGFDELSVL